MKKSNIDRPDTKRPKDLSPRNTKRIDILRDADSISFFHVNLPYYFIRNGAEETKKRCSWGYRRLSEHLQRIASELVYRNKELEVLVRTCISESE